ncbi:hypothetical protein CVT25_003699 [Psilocybe cyanescens]|uniref:Uncharacterized protein n=1 Tax=Psilocybe cyanescens TaxID=93625 RepID=A0A409X4W6_PSICY|nr:hypothetical protein CVT25_003699 [Psilocybe cyanescens]
MGTGIPDGFTQLIGPDGQTIYVSEFLVSTANKEFMVAQHHAELQLETQPGGVYQPFMMETPHEVQLESTHPPCEPVWRMAKFKWTPGGGRSPDFIYIDNEAADKEDYNDKDMDMDEDDHNHDRDDNSVDMDMDDHNNKDMNTDDHNNEDMNTDDHNNKDITQMTTTTRT